MLLQLSPSLWVIRKPFVAFGQGIGSRMTIVRLDNGDLWLHSPVELSEEDHQQLIRLGPIHHIVAPNLMHYMFLEDCAKRHPSAHVYGVPGLKQKLPHIAFTPLDETNRISWSAEIEHLPIRGMPDVSEVVFLHRATSTLILADLALHIHEVSGLMGRLLASANQSYRTFGPSRICKLYIRDYTALACSIEKLLEWEFDRIIVSHGEIVEGNAKAKLYSSYQWLFGRIPFSDRFLRQVGETIKWACQ